MGPRSPEGKAAKAIIAAVDKAEVNEGAIAYMLTNSPTVIHKRLFRIFLHLVHFWATDFDADFFDDESVNLKTDAKRLHETLERYGRIW